MENLEHLFKKLEDSNGFEREEAREKLVKMGEKVIPHLLDLIESPKHRLRWESMKALSAIKSQSLIPFFIEQMDSDESDIRWMAAEGLINIGKPVVKLVLEALIEKSHSIFLLSGAHHIFHDLIHLKKLSGHPALKEMLPLLKTIGADEKLKLGAYEAIKELEKKHKE